jgi:adenosylcobinamide-phosphate synthase
LLFVALESHINILTLVLAAGLDYLIGDPVNLLHPVQVMGWAIARFTYLALTQNALTKNKEPRFSPFVMKILGIILGIGLIIGSGAISWLIVTLAMNLDWRLGMLISSILLASCFAGRSLRRAAEDVLEVFSKALDIENPSIENNLPEARRRLSQYVGRDTENLTEAEILRAVLETISENAVDAVTAPLFYALVGFMLFPQGGVALAIAYKASSTLDSMVGYRNFSYNDLGWFSAKTEDILTWVPCRLTVITLGLISGKPLAVWKICRRDAIADPSPNSGWSECIYAAILGVQVGGDNQYLGQIKSKPLLGDAIYPITANKIQEALRLTRTCCLLWLGLGLILLHSFNLN